MRTEKALKNAISSMASYLILAVLGFVLQRVLKDALGAEYLGISGLFTNIISGLSVIELGFGSAIIVNMYRPVADNDVDAIVALLQFYKKVYVVIAGVVAVIGLGLLPFIDVIIGETSVPIPTKAIFLLYLIDAVASYLMTYKRSILYANQKSYYITLTHLIVVVLTNILQIVMLITTKNYFLYLAVSIALRLVENVFINILIDRAYPYVKDKKKHELSIETKADIKKKVFGLMFHKTSTFIVYGTDSIIISMVPGLGIIMVGVYSSYSMITTKLGALVDSVFSSITAGVGNLLIEDDKEKSYRMFKNFQFINLWIYVFIAVSFYYVSFPFIELWMGKDFVLDPVTVLVITLNLFVGGMRAAFGTFKNAAGIFYEDRYVPLLESIINIVVSIPLALMFGLKGVLIGTICGNFALYGYSFRKFVYGLIFDKDAKVYFKDLLRCAVNFVVVFGVTAVVMQFVHFESAMVQLIATLCVCAIVPNVAIVALNFKRDEFGYFKELALRFLPKKAN